ncbi:MAG: 2-oxo-4-hydroxy-4-carboxy-5-ureidoimidazoline decarboxylase [Leptolyngbyaceae cyanobacterium SL_1_1]|nr:2-oxo-4-hydroxy-4-carboxy-5-ureidoimidazoline decarboxylase [Leptolyngbyaceae cyanobacterium RM1_1_2]NJO10328.1 2-oxo-4-hydroxy-4-carboxy-5-ureidoimidazoline decarboxylase [Leptolyngbyaceae cyanobacterium SL_1_1]
MAYSIAALNQMGQSAFVEVLGAIFEDTPAIAAQVWQQRPFATGEELYQKMAAIVEALPATEQLALIRAHPDLGSKAQMATASVQEQAGVGLDRLLPEEFKRLHRLNQAYQEKFEFPFIVAVKNHTKVSILSIFEQCLNHSPELERKRAIAEISQIARFRLATLVADIEPTV